MATPQSLEELIRKECLPLRDCMLTITDANGEAAFLYFKEGELIEANYAALWGKEALAQIVTWNLADSTVAPLPLGIKRSLWDQLEFLLNPGLAVTASGKLPSRSGPVFHARSSTPSSPFDRFKAIAGLLKMIQIESGKENVLYEAAAAEGDAENTAWLAEFADRARSVGDTLGFGHCEKWTIDTERYQVVGLDHDKGFIVLLRRKDASHDDLDAAVNAVID
jgi:predicted regulator of Ras-like GTPase activity (Roadblock/LC7/MglB family)